MPGRFGDAVPQRPRAHRPGNLARGAMGELPLAVGFDGLQERVGDAHRVVGVLARNREVGFRLPIGVESWKLDVAIALAGELDDPLDVILRQLGLPGGNDLAAQFGVRLGIEGAVSLGVAVEAGAHHGVEVPVGEPRACDERGDLLLLAHLPGDKVLDVRVVYVDRHHLGGAPCGAARLDGPRRPIADLEARHQPPPDRGSPSPRTCEKLDPVPEPYLKRRASRTQRSMMPPSFTRSSETLWMKQACGCGRS